MRRGEAKPGDIETDVHIVAAPSVALDAAAQIDRRGCQSNMSSCATGAMRPLASDHLGRKTAPLLQRGRASLLVEFATDEMALLIEVVVELGMN